MSRRVPREEIAEQLREGRPQSAVARALGVSERTVLRAKHDLGLPVKTPRRSGPVPAEALELYRRLLTEEGWSYAEIEREYGHGSGTIPSLLPGLGWTPVEAGSLGAAVRNANRRLRKKGVHV